MYATSCKCKASKANDAIGLYYRINERMFDIDDNNAAYYHYVSSLYSVGNSTLSSK